jgi:hypothetical protein
MDWFWIKNGQKMKRLGMQQILETLAEYGPDATRWYMMNANLG